MNIAGHQAYLLHCSGLLLLQFQLLVLRCLRLCLLFSVCCGLNNADLGTIFDAYLSKSACVVALSTSKPEHNVTIEAWTGSAGDNDQ